MSYGSGRLIAAVTLTIVPIALSGCWGLFKSKNAVDPGVAARAAKQLAIFMEPTSNLSRSSGEVTYLRLKTLFPNAVTSDASSFLKQTEFQVLDATGLNRSVAQDARPSTAIAQIALRKWAAPLCKTYADTGATAQGALFSSAGIYLSTEKVPADPLTARVVAATRNAWLDIFTPDSKEVDVLRNLYSDTLKQTQSDGIASQTLCMAVLLAPQFWLGNTGPRDKIRRIALEIGRTIPRFSDYEAYMKGALTVDSYIKKIQTDPQYQNGYLTTVHTWHQSWWGLRPFLPFGGDKFDPRSEQNYNGAQFGYTALGAPFMIPRTANPRADGVPVLQAVGYYRYNYDADDIEDCNHEKVQDFDPRSMMITKEHKTAAGTWEVVGAFVLNDPTAKADYVTYLNSYLTGANQVSAAMFTNGECTLISKEIPDVGDAYALLGYPIYYKCAGRVSLPAGGFRATHLIDYDHYAETLVATIPPRPKPFRYHAARPVYTTDLVPNGLSGTVHEYWGPGDRRIRRKAPTGWQDGVGKINTWFTGDTTYACNNLGHFFFTCEYRPGNGIGYGGGSWWYVNGYLASGESPTIDAGAFWSTFTAGNPMSLNQFRCGNPDMSKMPLAVSTNIDAALDEQIFPHGYDLANYTSTAQAPIVNTLINTATAAGTTPTEDAAITRANNDIMNEPYRLIDWVLTKGKPYSELFTADYTLGREELELTYRQQNYSLPAYPPGYTPTAADSAARLAVRQIYRKQLPPIPANWMRPGVGEYMPATSGSGRVRSLAAVKASGYIPQLATSGILSMPAFLGPVSQKMRTVSARFYTRLLCGEPSVYSPDASAMALHSKYMVVPSNTAANATAALHLDPNKGCFSCHINLDPLAQALAGHFLENVQVNEWEGMMGEFILQASAFGEKYLGSRAGGEPGDGAFLGMPAHGVESVGRILAESKLMYSCVAQRTFSAVYGRPLSFQDAQILAPVTAHFQSTRDFNALVRELVNLHAFSEEN